MTIYSLDVLLFLFGTSLLFHVQFNNCFLTCIQISQEAGQVVWYSHCLKNFPQLVVINTVKGFGMVNKAEVDAFLELSCFFSDPADTGNFICGSSAFSKSTLSIWQFTVHIFLKPSLENFEHYFTSLWDECNCAVLSAFFGIVFLCGRSGGWVAQKCPWGYTPRPRWGMVAERSYPTSKVRRGGRKEIPTFKVRETQVRR